MTALQSQYNPHTGLWRDAEWWQNAVILDTLIASRTSTFDIAMTYEHNHQFLNGYYDDEGWWGIAWFHAYQVTHETRYLEASQQLFNDMTTGWDSVCGGIWWDKSHTYNGAIENELFLRLALLLHKDAWVSKEWNWFSHSGLINASYLVNDGLTPDCHNNGLRPWSYNQGVILADLVDLGQVTLAEHIADANNRYNANRHGVLYERGCEPWGNCGMNGAMFKGIYMMNLGYLNKVDSRYSGFIAHNATSVWDNDRTATTLFGLHWSGPVVDVSPAADVAGVDALIAGGR